MKTALLGIFVLLVVIVEINGGKYGGGGGRRGGGGSRSGGGSRGSSSTHYGGGSGSSSSHQASNNWAKARDKVRNPPPRQEAKPKPQPQPNHDNAKLSYGQHEMSQSKPNDHKPSAPSMEAHNQGSQNINKQTVSNQQSGAPNPSAPNAPPPGWNTGQNPAHNAPGIGFDNVNKQAAGGAPHAPGIGFDNVNKQAAGGVPHAPHQAGTVNQQQGINSQNIHPSQNGYNPNGGYPPNTGPGGYNQGGYNQGGYNQGGYNQPGYNQGGYHPGGYNQGGYHPAGGQGGYHPQQPGGYGGHGYGGGYGGNYHQPAGNVHYGPVTYINGAPSPPSYSYYQSSGSNTLLGVLIGYQVGRMFSHSHTPYFSDRTYEIHHYHHDTTQPEKVTVQANTIVGCAENITLLCISSSYPVCVSNGTIMCVTNPQLTAPCKENSNFSCVETKIDCTKNPMNPACNETETKEKTMNVPCVSSVSIFGDLSMLQNVINTTAQIPDNVTVTSTNNSISVANNPETTTGAAPDGNATTPANGSTTTTNVITNTIFCVTVIAVPHELIQPNATTPAPPIPKEQEQATSPHVSEAHVGNQSSISSASHIWSKTTPIGFLCIFFVPFVIYCNN